MNCATSKRSGRTSTNASEKSSNEFEFKERVLDEYAKLGISIHVDKAGVMRALSQRFARNEMKKVYALIMTSRPKS